MTMSNVARAAMAALIAAAFAGAARAEIKNYEFQLVQPTVKRPSASFRSGMMPAAVRSAGSTRNAGFGLGQIAASPIG